MTMPLYERIVNQCSISLHFENPECRNLYSCREALDKIKEVTERDGITKLYNNETVLMKVSEVFIADTYACLLISKIDKEVADVVYSDIETLERREIPKGENEGNTICCHVLISLSPTSPINLTFKCAVERMYGVGLLSDVGRFLKYIFKEYTYVNFGGKAISPKLNLTGRECNSIRETLSSSMLSRIKFSSKKEYKQGIDEANYISVDEKSIVIKDKPTGESAINFLTNILTLHKPEYSYASITVIDDGQQKTNEIELDRDAAQDVPEKKEIDDILGQAFFKPEKVSDFDEKLDVAYANIREDLMTKMVSLL